MISGAAGAGALRQALDPIGADAVDRLDREIDQHVGEAVSLVERGPDVAEHGADPRATARGSPRGSACRRTRVERRVVQLARIVRNLSASLLIGRWEDSANLF
jgi:hypothetical protein